MIDEAYCQSALRYLQTQRRIVLAPGLSNTEIAHVEATYQFQFPPDLRLLLKTALPISDGFPNWRVEDDENIQRKLAWPLEGLCFDIEHNNVWLPEWGPRPTDIREAFAIAGDQVAHAPRLIPVYGHRYLPATPHEAGNPVFSVWQTDIIWYGTDLPSYLTAEFGVPNPYPTPEQPRYIPFWTDWVISW